MIFTVFRSILTTTQQNLRNFFYFLCMLAHKFCEVPEYLHWWHFLFRLDINYHSIHILHGIKHIRNIKSRRCESKEIIACKYFVFLNYKCYFLAPFFRRWRWRWREWAYMVIFIWRINVYIPSLDKISIFLIKYL